MMPLPTEGNESNLKRFVTYVKKNILDIENSGKIMFIQYRWVKGHCYYTGKYRVAAHNTCNLGYKNIRRSFRRVS